MSRARWGLAAVVCLGALAAGCADDRTGYDVVIRGGTVYDGSGAPPVVADVGIRGDRIAALGNLSGAEAAQVLDASGMAVSPGFINMLSWASICHPVRICCGE